MKGIPYEVFPDNPALEGLAQMQPPVRYSEAHGDCLLYLITPWRAPDAAPIRRPLIVFVQGSGWKHPNPWFELPQLSMYAQAGYVVASVAHRSALDGFPFPAYLQDVKTAIRYLRAHADELSIDPARVCVWGTSSGGNTALLVGVTANDARYETEEYAGVDDGAQLIVDFFGPANLPKMAGLVRESQSNVSLLGALAGSRDPMEVAMEMSPVSHLKPDTAYPPMLLAHGDADPVVDFSQSEEMHEKLLALGQKSTLIRVTNAVHEGNTWSRALHARVRRFIDENL